MFYTLASKIPLIPAGKNHFLIVFVIGSLAYIVLSYYLYSGNAPAFVDSYKTYMYFLMALDLAIAYFLSKGTHNAESDETDGYTKQQKKQIEDDLAMLRNSKQNQIDVYTQRAAQLNQEKVNQAQFQAQQRQSKRQQAENEEEDDDDKQSDVGSNRSPFKTIDEVEEDDRREREEKEARSKNSGAKKISSSNDEDSEEEKPKKKIIKTKTSQKKKKNTDEDTDIPVYGV